MAVIIGVNDSTRQGEWRFVMMPEQKNKEEVVSNIVRAYLTGFASNATSTIIVNYVLPTNFLPNVTTEYLMLGINTFIALKSVDNFCKIKKEEHLYWNLAWSVIMPCALKVFNFGTLSIVLILPLAGVVKAAWCYKV